MVLPGVGTKKSYPYDRTVSRVKNWTTGSSAFNLFSFLGGFLQIGREVRVVNSVNGKNFVHKLATSCVGQLLYRDVLHSWLLV